MHDEKEIVKSASLWYDGARGGYMEEGRVGVLEPGNRLRRKESNTFCLIRRVTERAIVMLSEDGKSSFTVKRV